MIHGRQPAAVGVAAANPVAAGPHLQSPPAAVSITFRRGSVPVNILNLPYGGFGPLCVCGVVQPSTLPGLNGWYQSLRMAAVVVCVTNVGVHFSPVGDAAVK